MGEKFGSVMTMFVEVGRGGGRTNQPVFTQKLRQKNSKGSKMHLGQNRKERVVQPLTVEKLKGERAKQGHKRDSWGVGRAARLYGKEWSGTSPRLRGP